MINVQNVTYSYHGRDAVFENISFEQEKGHCLALLGNNGAGKSTLLKCLNRILEPKQGIVEVDGKEIHSLQRGEIAKEIAYVEQQTEAGRLTVYDTVLLGRKPYIKFEPGKEDYRIAENAMERLNIKELALRFVDELSGGERQKVVLARALAQEPAVLLLDEPTSNLDLHNQHEVMRIVSQVAREDNMIVIVVIHDLNLALRYCDRFLLMKEGQIYSYGDESTISREAISEVYQIRADILEYQGNKLVVVGE